MSDNKVIIKKKIGLGKGLSALLEDNDTSRTPEEGGEYAIRQQNAPMQEIPVAFIETNPFQPRVHFEKEALEELAESIRIHGIIQPITVRQLTRNQFQLISGERRLQASKLVGLETIPAFIRTADDQQMLEMAIIENIQRENLNALEIALSYQRLLSECNLKQEELGERVGKKRSTVNNYLRLLKLPTEIQASVRDNKLSMGHARALINVDNIEDQLYIFRKIIKDDLSVRKVEELVRQFSVGPSETRTEPASKELSPLGAELKSIQNRLASHFGTRVLVKNNGANQGEIRIPYLNDQDLNRILEIINL
jgi:ParB family transcriptional regulator, chromosome partitioning protein